MQELLDLLTIDGNVARGLHEAERTPSGQNCCCRWVAQETKGLTQVREAMDGYYWAVLGLLANVANRLQHERQVLCGSLLTKDDRLALAQQIDKRNSLG